MTATQLPLEVPALPATAECSTCKHWTATGREGTCGVDGFDLMPVWMNCGRWEGMAS